MNNTIYIIKNLEIDRYNINISHFIQNFKILEKKKIQVLIYSALENIPFSIASPQIKDTQLLNY